MTDEATIYLVDDDEAVRDALGLLLRSVGYRAVLFDSAQKFLASNPSSSSTCLLADIRMPGMDGLELQEQVVARRLGVPVIIMTGHADVPLAVRAMRAGAINFLEKPVEEKLLLESIENALQRGARLADRMTQAKSAVDAMVNLTPREKEVLDLLVLGHASKVIAHHLTISPRTVEIHRIRVMEKMKARNVAELVRKVLAVEQE